MLSRRDIRSAIITGLTTGIIAWRILEFLLPGMPIFGIPSVVFVVVVPIAWLAGVQLGYVLGSFFPPFVQFGRFVAIGFSNAMVDFGILYLGIALLPSLSTGGFSLLKAISFSIATVHSYFWNKYWAFEASASRGGTQEAVSFAGVAIASAVVNVAVATTVVAFRPDTVSIQLWVGVGAVAGSAVALIFSFIGFRMFVFRKRS
jgi:putative flippase GtrA